MRAVFVLLLSIASLGSAQPCPDDLLVEAGVATDECAGTPTKTDGDGDPADPSGLCVNAACHSGASLPSTPLLDAPLEGTLSLVEPVLVSAPHASAAFHPPLTA